MMILSLLRRAPVLGNIHVAVTVHQNHHQQLRRWSSSSSSSSSSSGTFELPVVSVAPFFQCSKGSEYEHASDAEIMMARDCQAEKLDRALKDVGFFYLEGHGVAPELLKAIRDESRTFFDAPDTTKVSTTSFATRMYSRTLLVHVLILARAFVML
jgi:hypothetical protein